MVQKSKPASIGRPLSTRLGPLVLACTVQALNAVRSKRRAAGVCTPCSKWELERREVAPHHPRPCLQRRIVKCKKV